MKTFFVKKAKGAAKPAVGTSILSKKPAVGSYINFNVGSEVKIPCILQGAFDINPLTGNLSIAADSVYVYGSTITGSGVEYCGVDLYYTMPEYGEPHTVDQLLEMVNKRCGGMFYFVLENNLIYITKNGFTADINTISIGADYN